MSDRGDLRDPPGEYGAATYGDAFADVYDDWYGEVSDVAATVAGVGRLAGRGPVLELGVGTGRVAIALAAADIAVDGVDASSAMLARLAANDPAGRVRALLGDMADPPVSGPYRLAFTTFNTFFNLWREVDQQQCVRSVATLLEPGGRFVVEAFVPGPAPADIERERDERPDGAGGRVVRISERDPATQVVTGEFVHHRADGAVVARPWRIRYLYLHQLDDLCASRGLALEHRWATWDASPFDPDVDTHHVSVYRSSS